MRTGSENCSCERWRALLEDSHDGGRLPFRDDGKLLQICVIDDIHDDGGRVWQLATSLGGKVSTHDGLHLETLGPQGRGKTQGEDVTPVGDEDLRHASGMRPGTIHQLWPANHLVLPLSLAVVRCATHPQDQFGWV